MSGLDRRHSQDAVAPTAGASDPNPMKRPRTNPFFRAFPQAATPSSIRWFGGLAAGAALICSPAALAQSTWNPDGPTNSWNLTDANWNAGATWTNGNTAIFGGTAETVEIDAAISAAGITFNSSGYVVADADNNGTLTLSGTPGTITVTTAGHLATISENIEGSGGLAKAGAGTLTLSGTNVYSGGTTITGILNAANSQALGSGTVTVNGAAGNQLQLAPGVNVSNPLVIDGGGVVAQGVLFVPAGNATYSGPITLNAATNAGGHFATAGQTSVLTLAGDNTITSAVPVTVRNGIVRISGAQGYTGGTTLANGGAMIHFDAPASMPATGTVALSSGTTLGVNAGGSGFSAGGTGAGTIAGLLAGTGGQGAPVTLAAGSSLALDTSGAGGTVTFSDAFTSANNIGLLKLGSGTLELTGGGTYGTAGGAGGIGGFPFIVRQGTVRLEGANTVNGELVVGGTFGTAAGAAGLDATLQVDSGSLATSSWLSVGRGNGVGAASSSLIVNNAASVTAANLAAGFNAGSALNMPKGQITLNDNAQFAINTNGAFQLAESPGSNFAMTLNDASQAVIDGTGSATNRYIGNTGAAGTLTINGDASFNNVGGILNVGYQTGAGTLAINGGTFNSGGEVRVGASNTNGAFGGGSGTIDMAGGTATASSLALARGNNNEALMNGTMNLTGGTFTSANDVVLGFAGAGNIGRINIDGGTLNVGTTATKWLQVGVWDTSRGRIDIESGNLNLNAGTSIKMNSQGTTGANVINHNGGDVTFYSDNATTVGGGGDLDLQRAGSAASNNTYNLNGGTLTVPRILATATTGTRTFNFNGGTLRAAADGQVLMANNAASRANVRDNGAIVDTNGYSVSIAQPLLHSNIVDDAAIDGGLTKTGAGTLTLSGASTYTGATTVQAGTLALDGSLESNLVVASGATLTGSGMTSGSATFNGGSTLLVDTALSLLTGNVNFSGPTTVTFTGGPLTQGESYTVIESSGTISGTANLSATSRGTFNTTGNRVTFTVGGVGTRTWSGTDGVWQVGSGPWAEGDQAFANGDTVVFNNPAAPSTITLSGQLFPAEVLVNNSTNPYTFTGTGSIAGPATLTKSGAGALTLANGNAHTGGTILEAGVLNLNHPAALGNGPLTLEGGTIDNTSGAPLVLTGTGGRFWDGDFTFAGTHPLDMGNGAFVTGGEGDTRTLTVSAGTLTVGEITSAFHKMVKAGPGTLVVRNVGAGAAASVVSESLEVAAGTLQINRTGTDAANSGDFTAGGLTGSGTLVNGAAVERWFFTNPGTGSIEFTGTLANGGSGGLGFNKSGAGTQILSGANSYTGQTTVNGGTLELRSANSGAGTNAVVDQGRLTLAHTQALGTNSLIRLAGTDVSTLEFATDTAGTAYAFTQASGTSSTIVSNRATPGAGINHTLTTQNLANGVGGATLNFVSGSNVTTGMGRITFTQLGLGAGSVQTTVLNPTSANVTIGTVSKQNNDVSQTIEFSGTTTDNRVTGVISNGPPLTGANAISVVKSGIGRWTLEGNNTYTGSTTVNEGTLTLTRASLPDGAGVTVNGNGVLELNHTQTDIINRFFINGVEQQAGVWGSLTSDAEFKTARITGTGKLIAAEGSTPSQGFSSWAEANGLTAGVNDGPTQDPDNDSIPNLLEYVLGGNPLAANRGILPVATVTPTNFVFTFTRSDASESDAPQTFQWSTGLQTWNDVAIGAASSGPDAQGATVTVVENAEAADQITVTVPRTNAASGRIFGRLRVQTP